VVISLKESTFKEVADKVGNPLSPDIFIVCAEILAIQIRLNKNIKGITVHMNVEKRISQLADDTSLSHPWRDWQ
jgi:hypothetical protein